MATATKHPSETEKPEEHIREESLYKASTDLTEFDVFEGAAPNIWKIQSTVLVRADSEESAAAKLSAGYGTWAEQVGDADVKPATAKDLAPSKDTNAERLASAKNDAPQIGEDPEKPAKK
jgi:hypothetical protein